MAEKISELQKEKDIAEAKLRETTSTVASLTDELRNEKLNSSSVRDWARSAKKENVAIKRAIQSLGCKVQFSEDGDCIVGIENIAAEIPQKSLFSIEDMQSSLYMQSDEKPDSLVYVTREEDEDGDSINPINQVCESLCPLRTREGGCRWPEAGCAQFGSQFVGMKENFDAFDRLSIYDSYFQSQ
ncbi:phosphatidylinositol-3-phosphatase myotubularin-2-like [Salvia splendens]|nr:phosphatidylinositol-3-phosphatase myotubularin-2-like [Salvia splendens]XP_042027721.1 phosphatidylinositol-3-phosphatase myotubularin-2-like [Salvia splendens]